MAGNTGSASVTYSVIYDWSGFFRPVDNGGVYNVAKAGSSIPVKFSLGGNQGLNIMAAGSPSSQKITCDTGAASDDDRGDGAPRATARSSTTPPPTRTPTCGRRTRPGPAHVASSA